MSILSAGVDESPIPGRSGAITVNFSASNGSAAATSRSFGEAVQQKRRRSVARRQIMQLQLVDLRVARDDCVLFGAVDRSRQQNQHKRAGVELVVRFISSRFLNS